MQHKIVPDLLGLSLYQVHVHNHAIFDISFVSINVDTLRVPCSDSNIYYHSHCNAKAHSNAKSTFAILPQKIFAWEFLFRN